MRPLFVLAGAVLAAMIAPAVAQDSNVPALGEVVVTASRLNAPYAQQNRPVVGLRRRADSAVTRLTISSDSRDASDRTREIHTMLAAALDRAPAAGVELVIGAFDLVPVTRANYRSLPMLPAGRVDTSRVELMIKVRLTGSAEEAQKHLKDFAEGIPRTGRALVEPVGDVTLTIVNPDQYRDRIVQQVAESARQYAAMFGPDYGVQVAGIDGQVAWSQVSPTEVFLYIPYSYTVVPR
jgi:hypothetical protein